MPTGVKSFKIYHNGSTVVNNPTSGGSVTVTSGSVYASATAADGYEAPTITGITTNTGGAPITSNLTVTLTAGAQITNLTAPTMSVIGWDNDQYDEWMYVTITNPNTVSVTANVSVKDHTGTTLETNTFTLAAGGSKEWVSDYYSNSNYYVIECYFTSGSARSSTTSKTSGTLPTYTVTIRYNNSSYGSVNPASVTKVPYGTSISASGNVLTVGNTTVTATPTTNTAQYNYSFSSWSGVPSSGKVTGDITVTANFSRAVRKYTLTITNPSYGTVKNASGTALSNGATVTYGDVLTVVPNTNTAQYTYGASTSTGEFVITNGNRTLTVDGNEKIIFSRTTATYTITISRNSTSYGRVSQSSVTNVPYGTSVSVNGNVLTIGTTTVTATPSNPSTQWNYSFSHWSNVPSDGQITRAISIQANFERSTRSYTISYPAMPTGVSSFVIYKAGNAKITNPTSAGSFTAAYGTQVYAIATAATGYEAPTIDGIRTDSSLPTSVTGDITVSLTAGAKIVERTWQTVWSGSAVVRFVRETSGSIALSSGATGVWSTEATRVRITGTYATLADGVQNFTREGSVVYNNSYYSLSGVSISVNPVGTTNHHTVSFNALSQSYLDWTSTVSGLAVITNVTITKIEIYAPVASEPTVPKLSKPDVYLEQSIPDELYLEVSNNNNTAVTFYVTAYDRNDMAFGSKSMAMLADEMDKLLWVPLSSSVTSGYIEAYFTADGYEDSEILSQDWEG